ncbi:hypothetical protein PR048_033339 [Dryococelus australis]|uniref:Uncharacterized protein n=1 Tax=Dryococelus australis TaxID=614101 RepID=A0ABQ9G1A3_9NEOP|nr:hypothetical protein PR048_033339 [Dryococelus australis]
MWVIEVSMERRRNEGAGETGDPREKPPTNGTVRNDSHLTKSGDPAGSGVVVKCCKLSGCLLSAVHTRRKQQEAVARVSVLRPLTREWRGTHYTRAVTGAQPECKGGGGGDPRENPPTSGIVRHDLHLRKKTRERPGRGLNPILLGSDGGKKPVRTPPGNRPASSDTEDNRRAGQPRSLIGQHGQRQDTPPYLDELSGSARRGGGVAGKCRALLPTFHRQGPFRNCNRVTFRPPNNAMVSGKESYQHSPGGSSGNHGKPELGLTGLGTEHRSSQIPVQGFTTTPPHSNRSSVSPRKPADAPTSSGGIPHFRKPGIEPGSPRREAISLTTQPPQHPTVFDTAWRTLAQSLPSTVTANNQCTVDIGIAYLHIRLAWVSPCLRDVAPSPRGQRQSEREKVKVSRGRWVVREHTPCANNT